MKLKYIIGICIVFVFILMIFLNYYFLIIKANFFCLVNFSKSDTPYMYKSPKKLKCNSLELKKEEHTVIKFDDIKFNIPWNVSQTKKIRDAMSFFNREGKGGYVSYDIDKISLLDTYLQEISPNVKEKVVNCYGNKMLKDDFNFYNVVMETTPDQINWFTSRKDVKIKFPLIMIKYAYLSTNPIVNYDNGEIYFFKTKKIKGFLYMGKNSKNNVEIEFWTEKNRKKYYIKLFMKPPTKNNIKYILHSIKFVSDKSSTSYNMGLAVRPGRACVLVGESPIRANVSHQPYIESWRGYGNVIF